MSVIIPKTSDVSDSHILSSDLGYVGLPREAVLDNTATPAEQQAFDFLATISAGISATFFAPKAALIAGVAALLADCGSPGEAGDPTLALALNVDSKGGTTDEGDAITVGDNGRRGGGDILVASDNGGTSTPDDGMTVEDAKDDQNGTTDVVSPGDVDDALTAADDGGMSTPDDGMTLVDAEQDGAADASAQPDNEDTFVAADDGGMSIPDDGMTLVDAEQDGAADASAEPDDGDTFVAADDGGMNVPDDGMTPIDTIPDGVADDGAAEADIALAIPICKPGPTMTVKKNDKGKDYIDLTVNVGETANAIFLMSGNYYFCDNPILDSKDLTPEGAPLVEQTVTIPYSGTKTVFFDQSCTVYTAKGPLSNAVGCPPVNININQKPVIDQINPKNPALPSGDNQYVSGNTFDIAVTTVDADGDLTQCTATIKTPKGQLLTSVSDAFTINAQHQLQLPAEKFIPFGKYPGSVTCTDDKGAMSAAADFVLMTTDAYASLFLPADEGAGSIVKDWSKNSLVGQLMAGAGWIAGVNGSAINFPGKGPTVEFAANPAFSFGAAPFTIATWVFMNPPNGAHTIFANSDYTGYKFGFSPSNAISFYSYGCSSFVSGGGLGMATWGHVALTRYGNKFSLYTNGALVGSATCADDYKIAEKFWIGCDATGPKCVQPLNGAVDEVVFVGRALSSAEILAQCKLYDPTGSTCVGP